MQLDSERAEAVIRRVRAIPPGLVTTYGDLSPNAPRFAGAVLAALGDVDVPWHRVVRADGTLAKGGRQRTRLEAEGTPFRGTRVDMVAAWAPPADVAPAWVDRARRPRGARPGPAARKMPGAGSGTSH